MAYNTFGKLYKISGEGSWAKWTALTDAQKTGSMIFVDSTADTTENAEKRKIIYANGITYTIADATDFDTLYNYVHTTVDSSVNALETLTAAINSSLGDISTNVIPALDSSIKNALKAATLSSSVTGASATIALSVTKENETSVESGSITVKGDDFVKVGGEANSIVITTNVVDNKEGIEAATAHTAGTDSSIATAYAVKDYVESKMGAVRALTLKGKVSSSTELNDKAATAQKGDTYVVDTAFGTLESGDMIIFDADATTGDGAAAATYFVVERNLDGAVTAAAALTEDKVVLGGGNQSVKASTYGIGAETEHTAAANTLATENWVASTLKAADDAQAVTVNSSTATYLTGEADGSLGIKYGVITATLADVSNSIVGDAAPTVDGLATAKDVYQVIVDNEKVTVEAINNIKDSTGLNASLGVDWDGKFANNKSIVDAVKDLSTDLAAANSNAITSIVSDEALVVATGTTANDSLVSVSASAVSNNSTTLDASVLLANAPARTDGTTATAATGLVTDGYVKDYVDNVLVWEVL